VAGVAVWIGAAAAAGEGDDEWSGGGRHGCGSTEGSGGPRPSHTNTTPGSFRG
jgi:hypothetical protein